MPVASAFARLVAVLVAPLAVLRALERVRLAVLREVLRLRVAAAFLAEARRCVWVWVAIELAILPGRSGYGADLRLLDLMTVEVYLGRRFVTHLGYAAARSLRMRLTHASGFSSSRRFGRSS